MAGSPVIRACAWIVLLSPDWVSLRLATYVLSLGGFSTLRTQVLDVVVHPLSMQALVGVVVHLVVMLPVPPSRLRVHA